MNMSSYLYVVLISIEFPSHTFHIYDLTCIWVLVLAGFTGWRRAQVQLHPAQASSILSFNILWLQGLQDRSLPIRKKAGVFLHLLCSIHKKLLSLPFFFQFFALAHKIDPSFNIYYFRSIFRAFARSSFLH